MAVSGGRDSMSLLHFLSNNAASLGIKVIALNVEHGIRGESSIADTEFVKAYCEKTGIPLLTYSVNALEKANAEKLSVEQAARILRYECFNDALTSNKCDKIATAHHQDDNVETVLFNLFRGTGLKGLSGIKKIREDKIIRPFLDIDGAQISEYADKHGVPFVTDETNLSDDYTRNYIRHNITPKIKEIFPELNKSIARLSKIAERDDEYLTEQACQKLEHINGRVELSFPCPPALLGRAIIIALKKLGVTKDWEKAHIDDVTKLAELNNGAKISLPKGITAIKEYDKIVLYKESNKALDEISFSVSTFDIANKTVVIKRVEKNAIELKKGFYADLDKIPSTAVLRARRQGDTFTKFGGGTKSLGDYFTDLKIPLRERDEQILIADGNQVLAIIGVAVSQKIKVDDNTLKIVSLEYIL